MLDVTLAFAALIGAVMILGACVVGDPQSLIFYSLVTLVLGVWCLWRQRGRGG